MTNDKKRIHVNDRGFGKAGPDVITPDEASPIAPGVAAVRHDDASGPSADGADPSVQPAAEDGALTPEQMLAEVAAERDSYLDSLMRLQAEFDNYRRRSQRELSEARGRSRASLIGEFLPVFDNLSRALDAAEHHEEGKVLSGVRLTHNVFADLLRKEGVAQVDPIGAPFDPLLHEAVASLPSDEEEGLVIQVIEPGYTVGETVLRPARVAVSAGPAVAPEAEE
ncbi:MAG: nucleotide exchange factor GrpE [Actinobacteria bacterium]|nr:nucleotide exchange factor GrpE [Actinomycetota bacterium]